MMGTPQHMYLRCPLLLTPTILGRLLVRLEQHYRNWLLFSILTPLCCPDSSQIESELGSQGTVQVQFEPKGEIPTIVVIYGAEDMVPGSASPRSGCPRVDRGQPSSPSVRT